MNRLFPTIFLVIYMNISVLGQVPENVPPPNQNTNNDSTSIKIKFLTSKIEDLTKNLQDISQEENEYKTVGKFSLVSTNVSIKINDNSSDKDKAPKTSSSEINKTGKIKEVHVNLTDGSIARKGLRVILDDGRVFVNRRSPISLPRLYKRKADLLHLEDTRIHETIQLGDVITYDYTGKFYYPADNDFILSEKSTTFEIKNGATINQLIDVSIYTDLLGLLDRKPNGILQTEISGNFISNTSNIPNTNIIFHNFVKPYFRLTKYDSRFAQLDSTNSFPTPEAPNNVNRTYLNQISYLQAGLKTNIVSFGIGTNQKVNINAGIEIGLVNADSTFKRDITLFSFYPEISYSIVRMKNFSMECSAKLLQQKLTDDSPFENNGYESLINTQITLFYYPFSNPDNKVFLRFSYFDNLSSGKYNFSQFQIGWKASIFNRKNSEN